MRPATEPEIALAILERGHVVPAGIHAVVVDLFDHPAFADAAQAAVGTDPEIAIAVGEYQADRSPCQCHLLALALPAGVESPIQAAAGTGPQLAFR